MAKLVDPDSLNQATEVVINTGAKTIQLLAAGNLSNTSPGSTSGVTLQAVYSFLKEEWKTDASLNKFKFPLKMFTKTDGILINAWAWADATTRNLIRDGGWEEVSGDQYAGIISLGSFDSTADQAYYQHVQGYDATTTNFNKTGNLNEAILISGFEQFLKLFLRIEDKSYAEYNLLTEQNISTLEPVLYKLPLANIPDLQASGSDTGIDNNMPFMSMSVNYLTGSGFGVYSDGATYVANSVVLEASGTTRHWYFTKLGGTANGTDVNTDVGVTDWALYDGEREIGSGSYFAFNRIIQAYSGSANEIYNWAQRQLRKTTDINANNSPTANQRSGLTVNGNVAALLVEYVGDTLKTKPGVFIDNFDVNSTNNLAFYDITVNSGGVDPVTLVPASTATTERTFPFVSAGTLEFSSNLVSEPDADTKYTMYFTTNVGGNFDSSSAIIVNDNSGVPITGQITAASIPFDFDYDGNVQGGRTAGTDAAVTVVAQGLSGATWVLVTSTISRATGLTITVTADDERNYANP